MTCNLIEKIEFKDQGDVLRYSLDVLSNMAIHSDDKNKSNFEAMLKEGVIDIIIT